MQLSFESHAVCISRRYQQLAAANLYWRPAREQPWTTVIHSLHKQPLSTKSQSKNPLFCRWYFNSLHWAWLHYASSTYSTWFTAFIRTLQNQSVVVKLEQNVVYDIPLTPSPHSSFKASGYRRNGNHWGVRVQISRFNAGWSIELGVTYRTFETVHSTGLRNDSKDFDFHSYALAQATLLFVGPLSSAVSCNSLG